MCGFAGYIVNGLMGDNKKIIKAMADRIIHRGPDQDDYYVDDDVALGFRRLSIIDLEGGSQPILNEDETMVLTFNGEIYNFLELREELIKKGHIFKTHTDSEVLLHGYEEYGTELLQKLRGMYAFVIWDKKTKKLFGARDIFGIKPFYYYKKDGEFIFGSEIKSFLEHPRFEKELYEERIPDYLCYEYIPNEETLFKNVFKLLSGHYFEYQNGELSIHQYYDVKFNIDNTKSLDEWEKLITDEFTKSVEAHKISDVEVGCFLSSGVDSSYVSTYFADQKTFTVGFDFGEKYNEISWAKNLSEKIGVEHHTHLISSEEFWDAVPTVQYYMDQPLADPSCIALYFVSRLASEYVKVVLSGEGADELFGGYTCYNDPRVFKVYQKIVPYCIRKAICKICKKLPDIKGRDYFIRATHPLEERFIGNAFMYDVDEKKALLKDPSIATRPQELTKKHYIKSRKHDDVTRMQYLDINMWMVGDILLKADRMSMANSLELRVPFLDKEVFKVASSLPTHLRCNKENTKYAMRKAAERHLPIETAQKEKLGFPVPTRVWLRDEHYYLVVREKFLSKTAQKFFNCDILLDWLDEHYSNKEDNSRKVWTVYVFLVWYDIYFKDGETKVVKPENHLAELKIKAEQKRARAAVAKDNKQDEVIVETERILTEASEKMAEDEDADMKIATPKKSAEAKKAVQIDKTVYEDVFSSSTPVSEIISAVPEEEKTSDEEIDKILNEVSSLEAEKSE